MPHLGYEKNTIAKVDNYSEKSILFGNMYTGNARVYFVLMTRNWTIICK